MTSETAKNVATLDQRCSSQPSRPARTQTSCAPALKPRGFFYGFALKRETVFQTVLARRAKVYFAHSHKTARPLTPEVVHSADHRGETLLLLAASGLRLILPADTS